MLPLFNGRYEIHEVGEGSAVAPHAEAHHVSHVARLRSARGRSVHDAGVGQLVLQFQRGETRLGRLRRAHGAEILGFVTLVEYYLSNGRVKETINIT